MVYAKRQTIKKKCGRCKKEYEEHQDFDDKGIKLCVPCFIDFFNEQKILRRDKKQ